MPIVRKSQLDDTHNSQSRIVSPVSPRDSHPHVTGGFSLWQSYSHLFEQIFPELLLCTR